MEEPNQPISLRRKIIRDTIVIFIGFLVIVLCFIFLGVAQSYHDDGTLEDCDHCDSEKNTKVFRLLAAISFIFGFTIMTTFWWHLRAIRSAHDQHQRLLELQRLLGNGEQRIRRPRNRTFLGKRNTGWYGSISSSKITLYTDRDVRHVVAVQLVIVCTEVVETKAKNIL